MKTKRPLILTTVFGFLGVLLMQPARAQTFNTNVLDPDQPYAGKTYSEWATAFWQYYAGLPTTNNPFERPSGYPIAPLGTGQSGPVWFLCGNFLPGSPPVYTYTDTVPGGVALFTEVSLDEWGNDRCLPPPPLTEAQLRATAAANEDYATGMTVTIDGVAVNYIDDVMTTPYRVQSTYFSYTTPASHSVLFDVFGRQCYYPNPGGPPFAIDGAVVDGVFLMITPLSAGQHTIQASLSFFPHFNISETWIRTLNVLPVTLTARAGNSPGTLLLTWPQTPDTYTVETSDSLDSQQWRSANLTPALSNGAYQVSTQTGTNHQFFRLRMN